MSHKYGKTPEDKTTQKEVDSWDSGRGEMHPTGDMNFFILLGLFAAIWLTCWCLS